MREIYIVVRSFQNDANLAEGTTTAIKGFSVKIFKLTWTRRDDFVLFLFFPRPLELLSVPSTGWVESFSTLPSRIFSFSASSSTRSFELRTVWSSSSIDLWQAARPVINCCAVSREDRGVDPLDRTEDDDRPTELTRELEPLEGDGVRDIA